MKILQLILSAVAAVALVTIAVQLSKIQKIPKPVINIAAPQIPAPKIEEVIVKDTFFITDALLKINKTLTEINYSINAK